MEVNLTIREYLNKLIPDEHIEVLEFVLWNHTPFPFSTWRETTRQLLRWKRLAKRGFSECTICGKRFKHSSGNVALGAECGDQHI
jgi:hypothetical protein